MDNTVPSSTPAVVAFYCRHVLCQRKVGLKFMLCMIKLCSTYKLPSILSISSRHTNLLVESLKFGRKLQEVFLSPVEDFPNGDVF
jgi:hypothetical protein